MFVYIHTYMNMCMQAYICIYMQTYTTCLHLLYGLFENMIACSMARWLTVVVAGSSGLCDLDPYGIECAFGDLQYP